MAKRIMLPGVPPQLVDPGKLNTIIRLAVSGISEHELLEAIGKVFPKDDSRMLLRAAMLRVNENASVDPTVVAAWTFEAARELYRKMVEAEDCGGALRALKFMNDVAGYLALCRETEDGDEEDDKEVVSVDVRKPKAQAKKAKRQPATSAAGEPDVGAAPSRQDGAAVP